MPLILHDHECAHPNHVVNWKFKGKSGIRKINGNFVILPKQEPFFQPLDGGIPVNNHQWHSAILVHREPVDQYGATSAAALELASQQLSPAAARPTMRRGLFGSHANGSQPLLRDPAADRISLNPKANLSGDTLKTAGRRNNG
ncbi:hypothetical protein GH714_034404 [Hevea brasiliensis]|uniref:Uncharacterized protein n=1 Tax=Hevea brasiliensis TaxID=3981 RepID=A0A6A6M5B1_HEVBR|nr:hypothetical protein GH714_034404 [Hevea brasiliensis]